MENKLTLGHLSAYLPYGLRMIFEGKEGREITLSSITNQGKYGVVISGGTGPMWLNSCGFKPILRPLSDLTKEIEHNGEKFVPTVELGKIRVGIGIYRPIASDRPIELNIETEDYSQSIDLHEGYLVMQKLIEWHFDVFGLINKGLAIDINTIQ